MVYQYYRYFNVLKFLLYKAYLEKVKKEDKKYLRSEIPFNTMKWLTEEGKLNLILTIWKTISHSTFLSRHLYTLPRKEHKKKKKKEKTLTHVYMLADGLS